jgi:hypothetical protein
MFRGFSDRIETSAPVLPTVPAAHQLPKWTLEDIANVFNSLVPVADQITSAGLDDEGYSPQQRRLQETLKGKEPPPTLGATPLYVVPKLIYESFYAVANSTGSMNIAMSSDEINDYDDSAIVGFGGSRII